MPMDNVGQLVAGAGFIAGAISERFMPPWPASDAGLDFHGDRRLTDQQIQRVVEWVEGGAVVDVPENTPVVPTRRSYEPVEPDVTMTGAPYRGTLDLVDDYHHPAGGVHLGSLPRRPWCRSPLHLLGRGHH
jgi:hypothetical protein